LTDKCQISVHHCNLTRRNRGNTKPDCRQRRKRGYGGKRHKKDFKEERQTKGEEKRHSFRNVWVVKGGADKPSAEKKRLENSKGGKGKGQKENTSGRFTACRTGFVFTNVSRK